MYRDNIMKVIWWYVGAIDEEAGKGAGEPHFEAQLFDFDEAESILTYQSDRQVVQEAIKIFTDTFS